MRDFLYSILEQTKDLTFEQILLQISVSALLGIAIFVSYRVSHTGTSYSRKFNITLLTLTVLTATVMTVIGNNIALSLGMVGALSIVRFRTAIKDARDTAYIFWTIIVGICCGVGDYIVASVGSGIVFVLLLLFGRMGNDDRILLIVRGMRAAESRIEALVFDYYERRARLRVKNTTDASVELIYELTSHMVKKNDKKGKTITDSIYALDGIEYVNLVTQNDDIR